MHKYYKMTLKAFKILNLPNRDLIRKAKRCKHSKEQFFLATLKVAHGRTAGRIAEMRTYLEPAD